MLKGDILLKAFEYFGRIVSKMMKIDLFSQDIVIFDLDYLVFGGKSPWKKS